MVNFANVGIAKISVLPLIYVKLTTNDNTISGHVGDPFYIKKKDYILNFYSDSAGTIPFNVTGLNFKVKINELGENFFGGNSTFNEYIYFTDILSGTSTKILDDFAYYIEVNANDIQNYSYTKIDVLIENGNYEII